MSQSRFILNNNPLRLTTSTFVVRDVAEKLSLTFDNRTEAENYFYELIDSAEADCRETDVVLSQYHPVAGCNVAYKHWSNCQPVNPGGEPTEAESAAFWRTGSW